MIHWSTNIALSIYINYKNIIKTCCTIPPFYVSECDCVAERTKWFIYKNENTDSTQLTITVLVLELALLTTLQSLESNFIESRSRFR